MHPFIQGQRSIACIYEDTVEGRKDCARDWLRLEEAGIETRVAMATNTFGTVPKREIGLFTDTPEIAQRASALVTRPPD